MIGLRRAIRKAALAFADALHDDGAAPAPRPAPVPPAPARVQVATSVIEPVAAPDAAPVAEAEPGVAPIWVPPSSVAPARSDALELLRRLGIVPVERPFFKRIDKKPNPTGNGSVEIQTDEDTDVPVDDTTFQEHIRMKLSPHFSHLALLDSFDTRTQLPRLRSTSRHDFFPACGVKGATHSWMGQQVTAADLALAELGWVRYIASAHGPRDHVAVDYGCLYEGYVAVLRKAAPWPKALEVAQAAGVTVIANPEATTRCVLFGDRLATWLLTHVKPQLQPRMTEFGLDIAS